MPLKGLTDEEFAEFWPTVLKEWHQHQEERAKKWSQHTELRRYLRDLSNDGIGHFPDPWHMSWGFIDMREAAMYHKEYKWQANHIEVEITTDSSEAPYDAEDWERPIHKDIGISRVPRVWREQKIEIKSNEAIPKGCAILATDSDAVVLKNCKAEDDENQED
jgi:hypothetical protein